jgi:tol-pal system protein YbgF
MSTRTLQLAAFALLSGAMLLPPAASAQQASQPQPQRASPPTKATAKSQPPAKDAARSDTGDARLRGRVEQIEEQLADMQVVIGTLESLGRGGQALPAGAAPGRPAGGAGGGGVDAARVDSLETQIRALASQLEQLSAQVRQMAGRRADAAPAVGGGYPATFGAAPAPTAPAGPPSIERRPGPGTEVPGFGSTTVTTGDRDPIGRILEEPALPASATPGRSLPPAAAGANNPRELYETAYGYLLQQDYGAAEAAFDEFLRRFPQDRLAADAQYWLGETLYVQRRYKPAGQAFLAVVERHKSSAKVPNSLLKLAQSLEQLGQKDCGIFAELESRHPNAPADVRVKARALKQRQGC